MTTVELFPADSYNQKTLQQGHPPGWTNRAGGDYDLVVLGGGPAGLVAATTAAAGGHRVAMTEQRLTGVVYTTAADNSLNPKTRYNVSLTPSSAGALPWYHLSFSTNSVSWRWCASS
jgi:Pyridine nucleotide-disulphide oxidoreductase